MAAEPIDYTHVLTALRVALAEIDDIQNEHALRGSPDPTTQSLIGLVEQILTRNTDDRVELFDALCVVFDGLELLEERTLRLVSVSN